MKSPLWILRAFACLLPILLFTAAFPRTPLRICSSSKSFLYHPEVDFQSTLNSTSMLEEPSFQDVVEEFMAKAGTKGQKSEPLQSSNASTTVEIDDNPTLQALQRVNANTIRTRDAIEHIDHILNICTTTSHPVTRSPGVTISSMQTPEQLQAVAIKSMEGVLRRLLTVQRENESDCIQMETLDKLQDLLCRCGNRNVVPSLFCLETMWSLLQESYERQMEDGSDPIQIVKNTRQHVGRSVRLLNNWMLWSQDGRLSLAPPTSGYSATVFHMAKDVGMTMTINMWTMYQRHSGVLLDRCSREHFSSILSILAVSPSPWKEMQAQILKHMESISSGSNDIEISPTAPELEMGLEAASVAGISHDATWLYDRLKEKTRAGSNPADFFGTKQHLYLQLWIQSICNDKDVEGSLLYLENLLLCRGPTVSKNLQDRSFYKMFLAKLARSGFEDSGPKAEAFLLEWEQQSKNSFSFAGGEWGPDIESIRSVALAYLQAKGSMGVQLSEARRFLSKRSLD